MASFILRLAPDGANARGLFAPALTKNDIWPMWRLVSGAKWSQPRLTRSLVILNFHWPVDQVDQDPASPRSGESWRRKAVIELGAGIGHRATVAVSGRRVQLSRGLLWYSKVKSLKVQRLPNRARSSKQSLGNESASRLRAGEGGQK